MERAEVYSLMSTLGHYVAGVMPENCDNAATGLLTFKLCNEALFYDHFRRDALSPQTRTPDEERALAVLTDAFVAWDDDQVPVSDHQLTLSARESLEIVEASHVHANYLWQSGALPLKSEDLDQYVTGLRSNAQHN
ncbi:MAG: hypothetical protein AB8B58_04420 [Roseobacter sp.]